MSPDYKLKIINDTWCQESVTQNLHSVLIRHDFDVSGCVKICNNIYQWTENPHIGYDLPFHARFKILLSVLLNIQVFIFSVKQSKNNIHFITKNNTWWTVWTYDEDIKILGSKSNYQFTNGNIGENFNLWPLLDLKTEVWYKISVQRWTEPIFHPETMNEFWMLCEVSSGTYLQPI